MITTEPRVDRQIAEIAPGFHEYTYWPAAHGRKSKFATQKMLGMARTCRSWSGTLTD
jgi:hypothetical protein